MILAFISGMSNGTATTTPASTLTAPAVHGADEFSTWEREDAISSFLRSFAPARPYCVVELDDVGCINYFGSLDEALKHADKVSKFGIDSDIRMWDPKGYPEAWGHYAYALVGHVEGKRESAPAPVDDEWAREIAREAGMLGGIAAYNEVMGY